MMSAVQLLYDNRLACIAHLVGLEQLGYEAELGLGFNVSRGFYFLLFLLLIFYYFSSISPPF